MERNEQQDVGNTPAADALEGVAAIARYLGLPRRRTFYLLEQGLLPAGKLGRRWIASRKRLARHYAELADGRSAARAVEAPST